MCPSDSSSGVPPATPALSADEWAIRAAIRGERQTLTIAPVEDGSIGLARYQQVVILDTPEERYTVAALCLFGESFGFTQADVELLNRCANGCDGTQAAEDDDRVFADGIELRVKDVRRLTSLASRIANLLPSRVAPGESP